MIKTISDHPLAIGGMLDRIAARKRRINQRQSRRERILCFLGLARRRTIIPDGERSISCDFRP